MVKGGFLATFLSQVAFYEVPSNIKDIGQLFSNTVHVPILDERILAWGIWV
jgi:hypothetical protein